MAKPLTQMNDGELWDWVLLGDKKLEKKGWYRFVRLLHFLLVIFIVLCTLGVMYLQYDSKTMTAATLSCKDGTTWNAMDDGDVLDSYSLCGQCKYRSADGKFYTKCTYKDDTWEEYDLTNQKYKRDNTLGEIVAYPVIGGAVAFMVERLLMAGVVYVIAGKRDTEDVA